MDLLLLVVLILNMFHVGFGLLELFRVLWLVSGVSLQFAVGGELIPFDFFVVGHFGFDLLLGHCDLCLGLHDFARGDLGFVKFLLKFGLSFVEVFLCNRGFLGEVLGRSLVFFLSSQFLKLVNLLFGFLDSWLQGFDFIFGLLGFHALFLDCLLGLFCFLHQLFLRG